MVPLVGISIACFLSTDVVLVGPRLVLAWLHEDSCNKRKKCWYSKSGDWDMHKKIERYDSFPGSAFTSRSASL